jgi:hypothetical protein
MTATSITLARSVPDIPWASASIRHLRGTFSPPVQRLDVPRIKT